MREQTKSLNRRITDSRFLRTYFVGNGIDIGGFPDPLSLYSEFFPLMTSLKVWDLPDGDAQFMSGVADEDFDFTHSSHCLEHLVDPFDGLKNWFRITKPGGHLILTVPEEDLYEQGYWPSTFNSDHKWTFTVHKMKSWSPKSINIIDLLTSLGPQADIRSISVEDNLYRYNLPRYDQTSTPISESAIEFVVRKRTREESKSSGIRSVKLQPPEEIRRYLNQYKDDYQNLKRSNLNSTPFINEADLW
jgi:SAM-dependent methyltransferase